jgi:hypothetical protein
VIRLHHVGAFRPHRGELGRLGRCSRRCFHPTRLSSLDGRRETRPSRWLGAPLRSDLARASRSGGCGGGVSASLLAVVPGLDLRLVRPETKVHHRPETKGLLKLRRGPVSRPETVPLSGGARWILQRYTVRTGAQRPVFSTRRTPRLGVGGGLLRVEGESKA